MRKTIASYIEQGDHPGFIKVDADGKEYSITVHESNDGGGHTATFTNVAPNVLRKFLVDVSDAIHKNEAEEILNQEERQLTLEEAIAMIDNSKCQNKEPLTEKERSKICQAVNNAIVERNTLVEERNNLLKSTNAVHVRHYMLSKFFSTH